MGSNVNYHQQTKERESMRLKISLDAFNRPRNYAQERRKPDECQTGHKRQRAKETRSKDTQLLKNVRHLGFRPPAEALLLSINA